MEQFSGEQFLHQKDPRLHTSEPVEHEQERKSLADEETTQKPAEKIADWLKVIEKTHTGHRDDPRVLERVKDYYHKEFVIKPEEVPESYFENQKRMAREQGHGDEPVQHRHRFRLRGRTGVCWLLLSGHGPLAGLLHLWWRRLGRDARGDLRAAPGGSGRA